MESIQVVVISKNMSLSIPDFFYFHMINVPITFIDDHTLQLDSQFIQFDYLIILSKELVIDLNPLKLLIDRDVVVTNYFHQTILEHIYYLNSEFSQQKILDNILRHIHCGE